VTNKTFVFFLLFRLANSYGKEYVFLKELFSVSATYGKARVKL